MASVPTSATNKTRQMDAMRDVSQYDETPLDELATDRRKLEQTSGIRAGAPSQMLEMAKQFGLEERDIATPRWRALEVVDTCNHCSVAGACFNYLIGERRGDFEQSDCPNAERFAQASREGSATR